MAYGRHLAKSGDKKILLNWKIFSNITKMFVHPHIIKTGLHYLSCFVVNYRNIYDKTLLHHIWIKGAAFSRE